MPKRTGLVIFVLFFLAVIFIVGSFILWSNSLPAWELTAKNAGGGLLIEVYQEGHALPTYSTIIPGHSIGRDVDRKTRLAFPKDLGKTTFYDDSLKPGRWTLIIDGVEIDIMPARMILDGVTELRPAP